MCPAVALSLVFQRGVRGDVLALPGRPWGVGDGQHVWEGCPHACRRCCSSGCQRPAAGARRGVEKLGVELGAVTVIIVRNTSASVEEKRKCLDLPKCLTNLGNRIQNSYGRCSCRATQARKACFLVALGEWSSSKDFE